MHRHMTNNVIVNSIYDNCYMYTLYICIHDIQVMTVMYNVYALLPLPPAVLNICTKLVCLYYLPISVSSTS